EMAPGTPLEALRTHFAAIEAIARREVPEARLIIAELGNTGFRSGGNTSGSLRILLAGRQERTRSSDQIAQDLRRALERLPGMRARVAASGGSVLNRLFSGGNASGGRLTVQVRGHDVRTGDRLAEEVRRLMASTRGIADVRVSREGGTPEAVVEVDRARAAAMGVTVSQVARALEAGVLGVRATMLRVAGDEIPVTVRLRLADRSTLEQTLGLPVQTAAGRPVALRDVVRVRTGEGPMRIDRDNQERVVTVSGEPENADLGSVAEALRAGLRSVAVPPDFSIVLSGDYEEQRKAFRDLVTALSLALLLVFLVMVAQFESLRDPFAILLSVPACAVGVVGALLLTGTTLNVQSFIGIIVLAGIAVSNGIVLVDFINQLRRREGYDLDRAVIDGAVARLRPVLMTSATTVLALIPMALGLGEGGELQSPMARVLIGGLTTSTLITLFLVPIAYRFLHGRDPAQPVTGS
ncbi:MAG: efflux RND transporter permease subunit, partial [Candidatus Sericytochromatia bacterium]|nr:efflux RND transporter permease subunit [Candidatus Tanganyikabacteria bacterium]